MEFYRMSKGETAHYSSFEELRAAYGLEPVIRQTKDKNKLEKQRENFSKRHLCPACKQPMIYIGGNIMVCQAENCKGIKHESKNELGETRVWYTVPYELLDEKGADVAYNVLTEFN
jgi:hypothetical protein